MRRHALESFQLRCSLPWLGAVACCVALGGAAGCWAGRAESRQAAPRSAPPQHRAPPAVAKVLGLVRGAGIERQLRVGDIDAYETDLVADQYLYATFDQHGVDVVVDVFAPGRHFLFKVDGLHGAVGPESVHLVAETTGRYRLEVRALVAPAGSYLARLEIVRPASEADRRRALAERSFSEACSLSGDGPGFWEKAAKFEKAVRLFRQLAAKQRLAEALYRLGRLQLAHHAYREALDLFESARPIYQALGDRLFIALSYNEIGKSYYGLGEQTRALEAYRRAQAEWRRQPLANGQAATLDNLAELHAYQGKTMEALRFYREEAEVRQKLGNTSGQATALTRLGWVFRTVGDWEQALAAERRAAELYKEARDPQLAVALTEIGNVYLDAEEPRRALPYFAKALELQGAGKDVYARAVTLTSLGVCFRLVQDYGKALAAYEQALGIFRGQGNSRAEANTWIDLGAAYVHMHQPQRAAECYAEALRLARSTGYRATEASALLGAGIAARDRSDLRAALLNGEAAVRLVERLRADASRPDLQASFLAFSGDYYGFLIGILMQFHSRQPGRGFDLRALELSEQARARSLTDALAWRREALAHSISPALLAERQFLQRRMVAKDLEHRKFALSSAARAAAERELTEMLERSRELVERTREERHPQAPSGGALPRPGGEIRRALLDDHTLLLEYHVDSAKTYLWAVTANSVASFKLPGRERLEPLVLSTHRLLSHSQEPGSQEAASRQAAQLSRILLGPVAGRLNDRRLLIVADGALEYLPFAALPDPEGGGEPLIVRHEIVSIPSLAVAAELSARQQMRPRPPDPLALVADPVFGTRDERARGFHGPPAMLDPFLEKLPRLPHSRMEAEAIAALAGRRGVLQAFGFGANRELVTGGRLRKYRILHFATHGTLRTDWPEFSALALSQFYRDGRPRDGFLRAQEIADLDLPADLVVLSACETALGKELRGEGLVGLPQAFMSAGAQRVLVSLWKVGDRSTAELMAHFYRGLLVEKLSPAAALRAAQRAMWRNPQWRPPCFWAGFILQGDWR